MAAILTHDLPEPSDPDVPGELTLIWWVHTTIVGRHGLEDPRTSLHVLHSLTQCFTAEFDVRPFLRADPAGTLETLTHWVHDPSPHVRRLTSEGTRPRLPWGQRLDLWRDHSPAVTHILTSLRDDPTAYVRRSVANHLNDLTKDHPEEVVAICADWLSGAPPATRVDLVRHALRSLVKAGHEGALAVLGVHHGAPAQAVLQPLPAMLHVGDKLPIRVHLTNPTDGPLSYVVDVVVHYVKAKGRRSPKVFKLGRADLPGGADRVLRTTLSFQPVSTRTLYAGVHRIEVQVNGTVRTGAALTLAYRDVPGRDGPGSIG